MLYTVPYWAGDNLVDYSRLTDLVANHPTTAHGGSTPAPEGSLCLGLV